MNETGELLHGSTGSDSSNSSNFSSIPSSPPLEGKRSSGHQLQSRCTRETEKKKLKRKLMETKLFQRLMQSPYKTRGATYDYDAPRLGEVPARSKYNRPDQDKIHFSNHPTYLPLAEQCGPPQSPVSAKPTPRHKVSESIEGHQKTKYNHHIVPQGSAHLGYVHEDAIEDTQSDRQYPHITSRENIISTASSAGPTGLILVPQFRWAPKKDPGDPRYSTAEPFNLDHETCNMPMAHHERERSPSKRVSFADVTANYTRGESRHIATPQNLLHREQEGPSPSPPHSSSTAFPPDLSAPTRASVWPAAPQQKTGTCSFYGPIGTIGIKASHERHILECMCNVDGAAKHGYDEGYCSHQHPQRSRTVIPLTQLWCNMSLLHNIPMVDSPCLSSDEDDEEPADAREETWSRSLEENRIPNSNPSGTPQRTASYLFSDHERSLADWDQMADQAGMAHEVESLFSSSDDTDRRSNNTCSNSSEGSRNGSSSGSKSNEEYDIVDTSDEDIRVRKNNGISGDSTEPPRWENSSPNTVTTEMGLSALEYGEYEFTHSPILHGSPISRRPHYAAIGRFRVGNDDNTRRTTAAAAHNASNDAPPRVNALSAEMLAAIVTPFRQNSPIAFPRAMKQHYRTPDTVTQNAVLKPTRGETPASRTVASPRAIARATGTHLPNTLTPLRTMQQLSDVVRHGDNDSVCTPSPRLGGRLIDGSVQSSSIRRLSYRTTPGDDNGGCAPESLSPSGCGAAKVPITRTPCKHFLTVKHDETSVERTYIHNSPSITLPHSPLHPSVKGPKMLTKSRAHTAAKESNTPSRLPPLQWIDRGVVSPSPFHQPDNTVQGMYSPLSLASPPRLPQTDRKNIFPGVT